MKKKIKTEQNIIIIMDAIKKIMTIFLGPFLTAYFISTSTNSILNIAIYYIFTYATMALSTLVVAALAEKRNRIKIFRIGIILNFIYILIIILLKEKIINYLPIISILYGISASCYYFPYNLFIINKVKSLDIDLSVGSNLDNLLFKQDKNKDVCNKIKNYTELKDFLIKHNLT